MKTFVFAVQFLINSLFTQSFASDEAAYEIYLKQLELTQEKSRDGFNDWQAKKIEPESESSANSIVLLLFECNHSTRAGTGFFLEEDFPLLHTAGHVFSGCGKMEMKIYDSTAWFGKYRRFENVQTILIDRDHEHVRVRLPELENEIREYIKPLKRAPRRPFIGEDLFSLGYIAHYGFYKVQGIASFCMAYRSGPFEVLKPEQAPPFNVFQELMGNYYKNVNPQAVPVPTLGETNYQFFLSHQAMPHLAQPNYFCGLLLVQQGMSGGPVLNAQGKAVGINGAYGNGVTLFTDIVPKPQSH